jgi:23S rRNA (uracil1939-C5)-methyltransferase
MIRVPGPDLQLAHNIGNAIDEKKGLPPQGLRGQLLLGINLFRMRQPLVKSGPREPVSLLIDEIAFGGAGIGRIDGKVVFVPLTIDGERVDIQLTEERRSLNRAIVTKVLEPSAHRCHPPCRYFGACGGCDYQHITYSHQLKIKQKQVEQAVRRIGGLREVEVRPMIPSPKPFGFRNRITVHSDGKAIGFFAKHSRNLLDIDFCAIATPEVNRLLTQVRRQGMQHGQHRTLRGNDKVFTFIQTNDEVAQLLLREVASKVVGPVLVDAFCGTGFFAHALAPTVAQVVGIEWNKAAVAAARSAPHPNEVYVCADVGEVLGDVVRRYRPQTLLLDPSSTGLERRVIEQILRERPANVIYVSCNPTTFSRDLKRLAEAYSVSSIQPLDMFPQTAEIEVVGVLEGGSQ